MYSRSQLVLKYLKYLFASSNGKGHSIHSPFVFDFITKVMNDKNNYREYDNVEKLRKQLLTDKTLLGVNLTRNLVLMLACFSCFGLLEVVTDDIPQTTYFFHQ